MKKKKLLTAFLMLMVTTISLVTASYAWFTANLTVGIGNLNVNVSASNGIQISSDATNWQPSLTVTQLTTQAYTGNRNQIPVTLAPVSSPKTVDGGLLDIWRGAIDTSTGTNYLTATKATDPSATLSGAEAASTSGDYIVFDVFVQSATAESLKLTTGSSVINDGTDSGLKNATRVAIINEGVATTPAGARALWAGTAGSTWLWEPNVNAHTIPGQNNANTTYSARTGGGIGADTVVPSYDAVSAAMVPSDHVTLGSTSVTYFTLMSASTINLQSNVNAPDWTAFQGTGVITPITAGITKLRIYAWVEGQDVDCENGASGTDITFNLQFTIQNLLP